MPIREAIHTGSGAIVVIQSDSDLTALFYSRPSVAAAGGWSMAVLWQYSRYNDAVGRPIQLLPQYSFCPALMQINERPLFLFQFVDVLDEVIDYEAVRERLPGLSFGQIGGAIAFIRKLSQFNLKGINIDDILESQEATNETLIDNLRAALTT